MDASTLTNYSIVEPLRDGRFATIRAIRPDDKGLLIDALHNVGPESRRLRFFSGKAKFTEGELTQATEVDFVDVVALVAVVEEAGEDRIVGGGRCLRIGAAEDGGHAEVAFLVDDDHRASGSDRACSGTWSRSPVHRVSRSSRRTSCRPTRACCGSYHAVACQSPGR